MPASGLCSPVFLPCFPSIGVPIPLRLPKSARQNKTAKKQKKMVARFSYVLCRPASSACSLFLLPCFPSIEGPALWPGWLGLGVRQPWAPSSSRSACSSPAGSWGEGRSAPAGPGLVSYPLREALGSLRCGCGLDIVLCPLVFILGRVVFVIFS